MWLTIASMLLAICFVVGTTSIILANLCLFRMEAEVNALRPAGNPIAPFWTYNRRVVVRFAYLTSFPGGPLTKRLSILERTFVVSWLLLGLLLFSTQWL